MLQHQPPIADNKPLTSIRGVVALWVVFHHWFAIYFHHAWVDALFHPGYLAVDIFFTLSGLILTTVYARLHWSNAPVFLLRRIFRVYPLHFAALVVLALAASWPVVRPQEFLTPGFAASLLILQPFIPVAAAQNPPSWSIGVEMVCYAGFPLAIALFRLSSRLPASRIAALLPVLVLGWIQYEVCVRWTSSINGQGALLRGISGFAFGMALARLARTASASSTAATLMEAFACIGMAAALLLKAPHYLAPLAALLLFALYYDTGTVAAVLRRPVFHWLGQISFSVYLLHYPLIIVAGKIPALEALLHGPVGTKLLYYAGLTAALLLISTLSYRYIEQPGRRAPNLILQLLTRSRLVGADAKA